ncbi:hypothetical protein MSAS_26830 [Mycobacterium saskatchewanense]|uniref:Alpha/beta hydrolase n=1 Tax=Mycobacterium saskatchewanense TaxID=220927 RepID=A0AAJ3NQJ8_9MYCO|nr:hypothetical protein AWC23_13070 [Mycobacterium saskatchewanense]BBX63509.1 hypothetical protein MSAS_26830 [Mycobacterium saskatchewanense]
MGARLTTERVHFASQGTRCAGWLAFPGGSGPHPGVVLVHGLGATHEMLTAQYDQRFAASRLATPAFDYRHSGGDHFRTYHRPPAAELLTEQTAFLQNQSNVQID